MVQIGADAGHIVFGIAVMFTRANAFCPCVNLSFYKLRVVSRLSEFPAEYEDILMVSQRTVVGVEEADDVRFFPDKFVPIFGWV